MISAARSEQELLGVITMTISTTVKKSVHPPGLANGQLTRKRLITENLFYIQAMSSGLFKVQFGLAQPLDFWFRECGS
jgi:hypothetical protein